MSPQFRTPSIDLPTEYVSWSSPAANLWVASTPTAYVGMVDRNHDGFVGTDHAGRDVGVHETLEAARAAVYLAWLQPEDELTAWADDLAEKQQEAVAASKASAAAEHPAGRKLDAVA